MTMIARTSWTIRIQKTDEIGRYSDILTAVLMNGSDWRLVKQIVRIKGNVRGQDSSVDGVKLRLILDYPFRQVYGVL